MNALFPYVTEAASYSTARAGVCNTVKVVSCLYDQETQCLLVKRMSSGAVEYGPLNYATVASLMFWIRNLYDKR